MTTDVFEYLDAVEFLKDYFRSRKASDPSFSYEKWADEIGLPTKSLLRLIVSRKRKITDSVIDLFCRQLFDTDARRDYFCTLIQYNQTRSAQERKFTGQRLTQALRVQFDLKPVEPTEHFLSNILTVRVFSVLDEESIDRTVEGLSNFFEVPQASVRRSLELLVREKLIEEKDGVYTTAKSAFRVENDFGNKVLARYHAQLLDNAVSSFEKDPSLRRFRSSVALLSAQEFNIVLEQADQLVQAMIRFGKSRGQEPRRLYQMNFNVHSVSKPIPLEPVV